jgi:hypothetical protein
MGADEMEAQQNSCNFAGEGLNKTFGRCNEYSNQIGPKQIFKLQRQHENHEGFAKVLWRDIGSRSTIYKDSDPTTKSRDIVKIKTSKNRG